MCRDHDQTLNDSLGAVIAELGVFASEIRASSTTFLDLCQPPQ